MLAPAQSLTPAFTLRPGLALVVALGWAFGWPFGFALGYVLDGICARALWGAEKVADKGADEEAFGLGLKPVEVGWRFRDMVLTNHEQATRLA